MIKVSIPKGFLIGHADNGFSGVSVILAPKNTVCGYDCRGGAPGTRETDLLRPEKAMQQVNAVVLSGGSAYGINTMHGVMEYLLFQKIGYRVGNKIIPIVTGAVIYDLNQKEYHYPTADLAVEACKSATDKPIFGQVGVGKGATVGKIRGLKHADKSGVGVASVKVTGITVTAVVAVNALGDVVDPRTNQVLAGAHANDGSFLDTNKCMLDGSYMRLLLGTNTTIGCIMTDAKIDKVQAGKLASIGHNGLARTIRPVHTDYDGDTLFCLASGKKSVINFALLQVAVVEAVEKAIINAINLSADCLIDYDEETEEE